MPNQGLNYGTGHASEPGTVLLGSRVVTRPPGNQTQTVSASVSSVGTITKSVGLILFGYAEAIMNATVATSATITKSVGLILYGFSEATMNASVAAVATITVGQSFVRNLVSSVGVVIPSPLSPLLPFYYGRIVLQTSKGLTATPVAVIPHWGKSVLKRLFGAILGVVSSVATINKQVLKPLTASVAAIFNLTYDIPITELLMVADVVAVAGTLTKSVGKSLSAAIAGIESIAKTKLSGVQTFPANLTAAIAAVADGLPFNFSPDDNLPPSDTLALGGSGLIKMVLKGVTTASIAMTLVITREVDKNVTALVAVVGTIQNQTGKVVAALVAATATILNHIIRAANLTATVVANALAPIAQATGGVLKTQAITASVAALGTIKKQAMKNITVVLAAPTLILRKQVQLHIFPVAMIVATVTNGVAKRMIASVALVAPGPIGRFGLHFAQVMSTTVHMVAHLRECFSLRAHRHDPGAGLPLEAEDPDTVLTAHPHDSGCQE